MTPFRQLEAISVGLAADNVDTDKIFPARFLKTVSRDGLGDALFWSLRQDPNFVLNRAPWDKAGILIAGENFGCGSSREHAPWALLDFGIRCVIAPSIADIFYNNCLKNGMLPIVLPPREVDVLMACAGDPANALLCVDLESNSITAPDGTKFAFEMNPTRKASLLLGLDEIAETLKRAEAIAAHEHDRRHLRPWLPHISSSLFGVAIQSP